MTAGQLEIPGPPPHHTEARLEARLRDTVRAMGGIAIKLAPTQRGLPDRLVLLPGGRMHLVELKTNMGRLSTIQRAWHERVRELGVSVAVLSGAAAIDRWAAARGHDSEKRRGNRKLSC